MRASKQELWIQWIKLECNSSNLIKVGQNWNAQQSTIKEHVEEIIFFFNIDSNHLLALCTYVSNNPATLLL